MAAAAQESMWLRQLINELTDSSLRDNPSMKTTRQQLQWPRIRNSNEAY